LNRPLQRVTDGELAAHLRGVGVGSVPQNRRRGRDGHVLQVAEDRDERVGESERQGATVLHVAEEDERQHGDGGEALRPIPGGRVCRRRWLRRPRGQPVGERLDGGIGLHAEVRADQPLIRVRALDRRRALSGRRERPDRLERDA
jgi:hypothetical protein